MLTVLQIVIGIVFILLLFSLLATTIMEVLSSMLSLRGTNLWRGLRNMLGDDMLEHFEKHPFFKQLCENGAQISNIKKRDYPSYMSPQAFRSILMDTIDNPQTPMEQRFDHLPQGELRRVMNYLWRSSDGDDQVFQFKVEGWFNQVMDRVSGWYKRRTQGWLLLIGMLLALVFNADTIDIYSALSKNAAMRDQIESSASFFMEQKQGDATFLVPGKVNPEKTLGLAASEISNLTQSPLGLGWTNVRFGDFSSMDLLYKLVGWLTTALAISLGAPFWFDALRKLVNIRSSGNSYPSDQAVG